MALQTFRTDDLNGEPDAETVVITVNGKGIVIDLGAKSAERLTKALAPFWAVTAESDFEVTPAKRPTSKRAAKREVDPIAVRGWARANGVEVGAKGRVPQAIVDQYLRATAP